MYFREMVRPASLALCTPVVMGFLFRSIGEQTNRPMLGIEVHTFFWLTYQFSVVFVLLSGVAIRVWFFVSYIAL